MQADRAEGAHGHSLIGSRIVGGRHVCHARWKAPEHSSEFVFAYAQFLNAGEMNNLNRKRGPRTSRGGIKSPATPTRRSAGSLRRDRSFAALFSSHGYLIAVPTMRSSVHFPPNSRCRARS